MRWLLGLVLGAAALLVADRLLLAAEARGWVYWRRRRASADALGDALARIHALVEPRAERRLAAEEEVREEREPGGEGGGRAQPPEAVPPPGRPQAS